MRAPSSSRRLRSRPPRHQLATEVVHLIDASGADAHPDHHLAFHATTEDGELSLGVRPIPIEVHPFTELAGLVAPSSWTVFGLQVHGTGHHLDEGTRHRTTTTFAVDRSGDEAALLRQGEDCMEPGPGAEGTIPDLCRRVLGLPTPPPPARTRLLFALAWLDRLLEAWSDPMRRRALMTSFTSVAALHPAVPSGGEPPSGPAELAAMAVEHAAAWPWARLRAEPATLVPPGGGLPAPVAAWMDDGAYARWLFGAYPDPAVLALDVVSLLGPVVGQEVQAALTRLFEDRS